MKRALLALLALQVLAIVVYGSVEHGRARRAPRPFRTEPLREAPGLGDATLTRLDGSTVRLREVAQGPALLHGWATWCAPCVAELPRLRAFAQREGLPLIAVTDEAAAVVTAYFGGAVPQGFFLDPGGALASRAALSVRPETLLLDEAHVPRLRIAGARDWDAPGAAEALWPPR